MNLSRIFIERPVATTILVAAIVMFVVLHRVRHDEAAADED